VFLINFSIFFYLSCVRTHGIWQSITSCGTRGTVLCEKTHELERLYCFLKTCYIFSTDYSIHIRNRTEKVELLSAISNNIALQGKELAGLFQVWMYSSIWRVSDIYNTTRWPLCSVDQLIMWPSKEVIQYYSIWHWIVNGSRRLSVGCEDYLQACIYLLLPVIQRSIAHLFPIWLHFSWPHACLCSLQTLPAARSWYQRTKQLYCSNEHIQLEPTVANPAQARLKPFK